MPRIPRRTTNPITVKRCEYDNARPLITTSDPPPECFKPVRPPIVKVQPLPEHDEAHVRNVRETWEATGAHVRVLARERVQPEATAPVAEEQATVRDTVLAVAAEVKSSNPKALLAALNATMDTVGL